MDLNTLIPAVALIGGVLTLIKADLLNWIVAIFLIAYGAIGLAPLLGVDVGVTTADLQEQIKQIRETEGQ